MKATIIDLRYHMKGVLKALDRNETVSVLYHGKVKGVIVPAGRVTDARVTNHPFFKMRSTRTPVDQVMHGLREGRCRDL